MEQKNENEFLMLKNYSNFLIDLGLNISFSEENYVKIKKYKIEKNLNSVKDIDDYVKEWQTRNNYHIMSRNNNISSKNILLLSEESSLIDFDQSKKKQPELLEKMFASIGQNIDDLLILNIYLSKMKEIHLKKINEILILYFKYIKPKIVVDMCSEDLNKIIKINKFNFNFNYFKIPSVSNLIKNQSLKRNAWSQLKLLKVKLNEF